MSSVAVIGMGCRLPKGIKSPEEFWKQLMQENELISDIPSHHFDVEAMYNSRRNTPDTPITRRGGFLEDREFFDSSFFRISRREAKNMDPQQRLLLEVTWEALEDGGQVPEQLARSNVGVFVGMWTSDFEHNLYRTSPNIDLYETTGAGRYAASGRLSYFFDFQGPSLTIDTACSSSLVAVHLACQSLELEECSLAVAGGVNLIFQSQITVAYSKRGLLSPDGHCKFGDASANGYVRSEGVGMVVLKPLEKALAEGDPIYAVIRGSAVNNDGREGKHLVTPSIAGQVKVIQNACKRAKIQPGRINALEAHGTGTAVGDAVEIQALGVAIAEGRDATDSCLLGSVKTNIGHTEAAAGVLGLMKVALSLNHRVVPASLHFKEPSKHIPWLQLPVKIVKEHTLLPEEGEVFMGVNSFGITGTNAHVVLSSAPAHAHKSREGEPDDYCLLPLSAHTTQGLHAHVINYMYFLEDNASVELQDICYTASMRRTHFKYRKAFVAKNREDLLIQMNSYFLQEKDQQDTHTVFVSPKQDDPGLKCQSNEHLAHLLALARFYQDGGNVQWQALYPLMCKCVTLPMYPWQHEYFWPDLD